MSKNIYQHWLIYCFIIFKKNLSGALVKVISHCCVVRIFTLKYRCQPDKSTICLAIIWMVCPVWPVSSVSHCFVVLSRISVCDASSPTPCTNQQFQEGWLKDLIGDIPIAYRQSNREVQYQQKAKWVTTVWLCSACKHGGDFTIPN